MIAFEFDRARTLWKLTLYVLAFVGSVMVIALLCNYTITCIGQGRWILWWVVMLVIGAGFVNSLDYIHWIGIFWRSLRHHGSALVVNKIGIIDNATDYTLGQLTWAEIEKMYPWDWTSRLFGNRWPKMPVICRQRGIVICLKEGVSLQTRLQDKSWIRRASFNAEFAQSKRWLFIPEMLLATSADTLMEHLNEFYVTQVRIAAAGD
jgi:hypothetical protein